MCLQPFPSGGAAGFIVLLPWTGWEAGGAEGVEVVFAGGFRVAGLRLVAAFDGTRLRMVTAVDGTLVGVIMWTSVMSRAGGV